MKRFGSSRFTLQSGVLAFSIAACVALFTTYGLQTFHARSAQLSQAQRETSNLAGSLSMEVANSFQIGDFVLLDVRHSAETRGVGSEDLQDRLRTLSFAQVDGLPIIYALAVLDRYGKTSAATGASQSRDERLDAPNLRFHRTHRTRGLYIGVPVLSAVDQIWIIPLTRRIDRPDGTFGGVVEANIALRSFDAIFNGVDTRKGGYITLIRNDGSVLAREPMVKSFLGKSIASSGIYQAIQHQHGRGSATAKSTIDGLNRLTAFRPVKGYPLTTMVGFSENEMLDGWRADSIVNFCLISCAIVVIGFGGTYLAMQIRQRQQAQERLIELASIDGLTGLANRRQFDVSLERAWRRGLRERAPVSLLMIDADAFKAFNDRFGHVPGDEALKVIARHIAESVLRPDDLSARYGGEEFAVILADADAREALVVAERIRTAVASTSLDKVGDAQPVITVSVGVASMCPIFPGMERDLVQSADRALYQAKRGGRNRTEIHEADRIERPQVAVG